MARKLARREAIEGYAFILPWIIGYSVLIIGPVVVSIYCGFTNYDLIKAEFIGLQNYVEIFADSLFWKSLKVTLIYAGASVSLLLSLGLAIALLMNQKLKGIVVFRTIYYLPAVIAGIAASLMWIWLFNGPFGLINFVLEKVGISGPDWLSSQKWALPAIIMVTSWRVGASMLIYLAGLQNIPTELYEASTIDGAGVWVRFTKITLPMLSPVLFFNLIIGTINSFQIFTEPYVMTTGGPNYATYVYALYIYDSALIYGKFGFATALSTILLIVILSLTLGMFKLSKGFVFYRGIS